MNKKILLNTFRNTLVAVIYIFLVSQIMQNGGKLFGEADNMFTPFVVLLLFTLSAAVVGGLVFGQSLMLFLDNKKKDGVTAAIYSIGWFAIYTVAGFMLLLIVK